MRTLMAVLLWFAVIAVAPATRHDLSEISAVLAPTAVSAQQPPGELDVDVDIGREEGGAWYTNPVWLAIGALAVLVLIVLLVVALRGGGTTVVRD